MNENASPNAVGPTIYRQIERGVLMSLGAHNFRYGADDMVFDARILPFTKEGKRAGQPRIMAVQIKLNGLDYYDIAVKYYRTSRKSMGYGSADLVTHYEVTNVDVSILSRILLALDYDGDAVLNPRLMA